MAKKYKVIQAESLYCDFLSISSKSLNNILDKLEYLETFPEIGIECQDENWLGYRKLIVDYYRVLYKVDHENKIVEVCFAKHGSMDI